MKTLILTLMLALPMTVAAQDTADRWVPGQKVAALTAAYKAFCESVLGGEYGYTQTPKGPTGWRCKGGVWEK